MPGKYIKNAPMKPGQAARASHLRDAGIVRGRGLFTWTDEERAIVREAYQAAGAGNVGIVALAARLGRLPSNVSREARKLGLTRKGRPHPAEAIAVMSAKGKQRHAEGRGPKPVYGIIPSDETRAKMSAAHRRNIAAGIHVSQRPVSDETRLKQSKAMALRLTAGGNVYSRCKHGKREDLDGQFFRSSWEANYARFLKWQHGRGLIAGWEYEPKTFWFEKIRRGVRSYLPELGGAIPGWE